MEHIAIITVSLIAGFFIGFVTCAMFVGGKGE